MQCLNKSDEESNIQDVMTEEEIEKVTTPNFYAHLASSIAPEIYGHEDVKKALLLLLVGGVDTNPQGMKIRGKVKLFKVPDFRIHIIAQHFQATLMFV